MPGSYAGYRGLMLNKRKAGLSCRSSSALEICDDHSLAKPLVNTAPGIRGACIEND